MQQADKIMPVGDLFHDLHRQLVLVAGGVDVGIDRGHLVLRGGDLVVLRLGQHAELPQLLVEVAHKGRDARADRAIIVVVQLLSLRRLRAEERPATEPQVLALQIHLLIYKEIFLLRADLRRDLLRLRVAEQAQDAHGLPADGADGAEQRRLFVERFAGIGAEDRRDIEAVVLDEGVGRGVPRGVAARLECRAQAARRERGCVRFAAHQLLAGKLHADLSAADGRDEAVVLLGGEAGHRLEPVRKVRCAVLQRPDLHAIGNGPGDVQRQRSAVAQTGAPCVHRRLVHILAHGLLIEYIASKQVGDLIRVPVHSCFTRFQKFLSL